MLKPSESHKDGTRMRFRALGCILHILALNLLRYINENEF